MLAFSRDVCYYTVALRRASKYPGVAKFGIALEWGSRGLEFESRHSDQIMGSIFGYFPLFFVWVFKRLNANDRWTFAHSRLDGNDAVINSFFMKGKMQTNLDTLQSVQ